MKQRPYHPPEPRVIALAATKTKNEHSIWLLIGASALVVFSWWQLLPH